MNSFKRLFFTYFLSQFPWLGLMVLFTCFRLDNTYSNVPWETSVPGLWTSAGCSSLKVTIEKKIRIVNIK
jgi:hypothetical protein